MKASLTRLSTRIPKQKQSTAILIRSFASKPYISGDTTHFGFENVSTNEKVGKVREVFERVADNYDVMNDFMSAGLHRVWKDIFVRSTGVEAIAKTIRGTTTAGHRLDILDVAGGTGDIAFRFVDASNSMERSKSSGLDEISVTVCDINPEMLRVGKLRAQDRYGDAIINDTKGLSFVEGNAEVLPFEDDSFDIYTIAFGLRNVTDVDKALRDAHRVLKPGGRFMCLEFSHVTNDAFRAVYDMYSFNVIPVLGDVVAGDRDSYQYLVESIRKFSNQEELCDRMTQAGFHGVKHTNMSSGIVAIHEGWKL